MTWFVEYSHPEIGNKKLGLSEGTAIRIGRGTASDTKIPDAALSRVHCELRLDAGKPILTDLGGKTGTFFSGQRVQRQELTTGQTFKAGNVEFRVVCESELDAPTQMAGSAAGPDVGRVIAELKEKGAVERFPLHELVNEGGRNLVYRSEDPESGRAVAIKVLPTAESTEEDEARFVRAMKMLQEVKAPSLVKLYRAGRRKNFCWIAMEWFSSGSIEDRTQSHGIGGRLDWKDAWRVAYSITQSLEVLERHSIVHRNIRPTNILYRSGDDSWVLSDLVVAKAEDSGKTNMVTQHVYLPSNLAYAAPERLFGNENDSHSLKSDIYSLGAVLTEMLSGSPPYGHGELKDILPRLRNKPQIVTSQMQMGMNEVIIDLVNRMANPDPNSRFASASQLWEEVQRVGRLAGMISA